MRSTFVFTVFFGLLIASQSGANPSESVRCVQSQLAAAGFDPGTADGLLGARTRAALDEFQNANEVVTTRRFDAVMGPAICRKIGLIDTSQRLYWPSLSEPIDVVFAESVDEGFRTEFIEVLNKSRDALEALLGIELAGRDIIIVGENAAEIERLVRSHSGFTLTGLRESINDSCTSSRGFSGSAFPGIAVFCISDQTNALDKNWLDFLVAHEFFHLLQFQLSGALTSDRPDAEHLEIEGPVWLIEGSAQAFGNKIALQTPDWDYRLVNYARLKNEFPPLQGLERRSSLRTDRANVYRAGTVAAIDLIELTGYPNIMNFYALMGYGRSWEAAFEEAFGMSAEEFYQYYEDVERFNADGSPISGPLNR